MKQSLCAALHYTAKANMITAIFLGKLTGCIPGVVVKIRHGTKHFVFFQLFHGLWQLGIQSATPYVAVDGVQSLLVDLLRKMIFCKSPLCPAFRITNLPTGAMQFVPRRKATAVLGTCPTQAFKQDSHFWVNRKGYLFRFFSAHTFYFADDKW